MIVRRQSNEKIVAVLCCCIVLLSGFPVRAEESVKEQTDIEQNTSDNTDYEDQSGVIQDELIQTETENTEELAEDSEEELDITVETSVEKDKSDVNAETVIPQKTAVKTQNRDEETVEKEIEDSSEESVKEGFIILDGKSYYYENGMPVKGEFKIDGNNWGNDCRVV